MVLAHSLLWGNIAEHVTLLLIGSSHALFDVLCAASLHNFRFFSILLGLQNRALLKIYGPHEYFEASATVIYTHPLQGMGMVFREIRPAFANVLQKWLLESMRKHTEQINENR